MKCNIINTIIKHGKNDRYDGFYQFRKLGKMSFLVIRGANSYIQVFIPKGIINETLHIESVVE